MSKSIQSSSTALSGKHSRRLKKPSQTTCTTGGFKDELYAACKEMGMISVPSVKVLSVEPQPWILQQDAACLDVNGKLSPVPSGKKTSLQTFGTISQQNESISSGPFISQSQEIVVVYPTNRAVINMLICKHLKMTDHILGALQKSLMKFQTLKVLKLEFCQLTLEQLKAIKFLLVQNPNIIDVSLNGNDIPKQPYHILLKNTKILHLSLKFCKISDNGTVKLKAPLGVTTQQSLLTLNLSSNMITDNGAKHLAHALRTNRTLTHLILTDNRITDVGCIELIKIFRKFPLEHEEIVLRRQKNLHYLLLKEEIKHDLNKTRKSDSNVSNNKNEVSVKRSCSSAKVRMTKAFDKGSNSSQKRRNSADSHKSVTSLMEANLPKDPYPFVHECVAENQQVFCRGNFHLHYLNLSYNKITDDGLAFIKDTLKEQQLAKVVDDSECGLMKIILEGNNIKNVDVLTSSSYISPMESKSSSRTSVKERKTLANRLIM